jgi:hypothetical protein
VGAFAEPGGDVGVEGGRGGPERRARFGLRGGDEPATGRGPGGLVDARCLVHGRLIGPVDEPGNNLP